MNETLIPDYYSLNQLCKKWKFNLAQICYAISIYNIRLWVSIFKESFVYEEKIAPVNTERAEYEIPHNGFVELCKDTSSINPNKNLDHLFSEGTLSIFRLKCDKKNHFRFLDSIHEIGLDRIYIHQEEVCRVEKEYTEHQRKNAFDLDSIINTGLRTDLDLLIKQICPDYLGNITKKTSAPHRLVIRVIIIMHQLKYQSITWSTVREFIEEYICGIPEREALTRINSIDDYALSVNDEKDLDKKNAVKKVGDYKRMFKIF